MRIFTTNDPDRFADGDTDLSHDLRSALDDGSTTPDWWFVAEDRSGRRGRLALRRHYVCDEKWRGSLPEHEFYVFGIDAPWDGDPIPVLRTLAEAAAEAVAPHEVAWRIGTYHDHAQQKAAAARSLSLPLFQEKVGFRWVDDGSDFPAPSLSFRTVSEVGHESYAGVLSRVIRDGADREAAWYSSRMPAGGWGAVMMEFLEPEDADGWVIAYEGTDLIGQVALSSFDPEYGDGTIAWIGVVPERRGRGHGRRLMTEAQRRARQRGFRSMLSDTDTLNVAMQRTFLHTGHEEAGWHVWHYRWRA